MKVFFVFLLIISMYFQVQALPYNLEKFAGSWEDTQKKLTDLSEKLAKQITWAEEEMDKMEMEFLQQAVKRVVTFMSEFSEAAVKYIKEYEEWISKAKEAQVDPSNCTQDKMEIEILLPYSAFDNVTHLIQVRCDDTVFQGVSVIQNMVDMQLNLRDTQRFLNECDKTDEKCIKKIDDTLEQYKTYPEQVPELVNQLKVIFVKLMEIADTCVIDSIKDFDKEEKLLTGEAIQCIKDLINH